MARAAELWFATEHGQMFAKVWGRGYPLVLMHGANLNTHAVFADLAAPLDGTFQVIAPDLRGFGRSISTDVTTHSWDQYVADLLALLDNLQLSKAVVGGQSLGAGIAVAAALRHPERVRGLVIAQSAYAGAEVGYSAAQDAVWEHVRTLSDQAATVGLLAAMLSSQTSDEGREWIRQAVAEHDAESFLAAHNGEMGTVQPFQSLNGLRSIEVPTLLIPGDDPVHDPRITEMYAEHLQQVTTGDSTSMDPTTWVDDLRAFATRLQRTRDSSTYPG